MTARADNIYITRGLIVGTKSKKIHKPVDDNTHEWSVYVQSPFSTSLDYIQNVVFKLHETFDEPVVTKTYPFEVKKKGWGEFTIQIRINFVDPNEKPLNLLQTLVLHDGVINEDGFLVSERYEEIVFRSPTITMLKYLKDHEVKPDEFLQEELKERELIDSALEQMVQKFDELDM
ncbi:hypothetical protein EDEG_01861 [Edhazardia aedis USNM 41457]|uniref:Protein AF-9 homolog n=1 Tax=Edhazardia aedis (strain USNM 41457) TaxID=1003232 RepID=J9DR95_EDHAE|nr:hypothetical protein EDEG_01861 [Edhazardia aedis USNM 41457]|eukprot:EJW03862.1 hypothetical protein EDEG_01861 [Edhazardia aedis USNM 41457]